MTGTPPDPFVDLYKLAVEMADRISARRSTANAFFLTLNSAFVATIGLTRPINDGGSSDRFGPLAFSVAGVLLTVVWWALLRSYRELNRAKFGVINAMEARMTTKVFTEEWKLLQTRRSTGWASRYLELGAIERIVPFVYACIYLAAGIHALLG